MQVHANTIVLDNARDDYREYFAHVRQRGAPVNVRGALTYELRHMMTILLDPIDSHPIGCGRKLNLAITAAETLQLLAGTTDPELMLVVQPNFRQFMDGSALHGAYGPRCRWQLLETEALLRGDHTTRQAIVEIWDPKYDHSIPKAPRDLPCTRGFQFFIRDDTLELETVMRSNDVFWGSSYDWGVFTALQLTMANVLNIKHGRYYHHTGSLHVYARDIGELDYLHGAADKQRPADLPIGLGDPSLNWADVQEQATYMLDVAMNRVSGTINWNTFSHSEQWYLKYLCAKTGVEAPWSP